MFLCPPGKPIKLKKVIYLISFIILGLLLSLNLHALIEMRYLSWLSSQGRIALFYGGCALPPLIQFAIWALGIISGYFFGHFFWQKIYIERYWEKTKVIDKK
jgi:hypothetical protein